MLYDLTPVPWMLLDASAVIVDVNSAAQTAFGGGRSSIIGRPLSMWAEGAARDALLEHMRRVRGSHAPVETELPLKFRGAPAALIRLHSRSAVVQQRIVFPTVAIDCTERARLERALQLAERQRELAEDERRTARTAEAAKDRLIATVSHELRNPLSPALLASRMLAEWPGLSGDAREMAAVIHRNIQLEARLIDDLLDLARATRGQIDLRLEDVDVHCTLQHAIDACAPAALARAITIVFDPRAERHRGRADPARLEQVFWNLITNAIKFSHRGGQVVVRTASDIAGVLTVTVRDFGIGMDESTRSRLFSPFEQPQAPSGGRAGLGLGLTIARNLVDLHSGHLWAASDGPGTGSTFEVELPVIDVATPVSPAVHHDPQPVTLDTVSGGRVLIVEDHQDTGTMLSTCLTHRGYHVTLAQTLAAGVAALQTPWDVVISDIGLTDGSGLDLARHITASGRRPGHLIAVSGYGTERDIEASREAGFDEHLVKPIDLAQLVGLLERAPR
jgi:PAS domain S-box-containing protein